MPSLWQLGVWCKRDLSLSFEPGYRMTPHRHSAQESHGPMIVTDTRLGRAEICVCYRPLRVSQDRKVVSQM